MKNIDNNLNQNSESQSAQLAVIAGILTTLGDALATAATALAIQETKQKNIQAYGDIEKLQRQIDEIYLELKQLKKMLKNKGF